jgi:hypothetical protein
LVYLSLWPSTNVGLANDEVANKAGPISRAKVHVDNHLELHEFHVINWLPTGVKINSTCYTTNILQPLHQAFFPQRRNSHEKRLLVHIDNCLVHRSATAELFMKTRDMVSMPYPPYSPDLEHRDFYLFLTVKERLDNTGITDEDHLFEALHTDPRSIPGEELERFFEPWREGVQNVN